MDTIFVVVNFFPMVSQKHNDSIFILKDIDDMFDDIIVIYDGIVIIGNALLFLYLANSLSSLCILSAV